MSNRILTGTEAGDEATLFDTLTAELEDSRVDASDTAGQLGDALSKLAAAEQRACATREELREWKAMYAKAYLPVAYDHQKQRGDTYRARALALHKLVRRWKPEAWRLIDEKLDAETDAIAARELLDEVLEHARHDEGCSRGVGEQYRCRCGWSELKARIERRPGSAAAGGHDDGH